MNKYINVLSPGIKYLILRVTNDCNAHCSFCLNRYYQNKSSGGDIELTAAEYEKIARLLKGLVLLNLSGGEPYLRSDLYDIANSFIVHSGVRLISSPTNGFYSDRICEFSEKILTKHKNIILKIGISIDAVGGIHDKIRGLPGSYEKAIATARSLQELKNRYPNLMIHAVTTASLENIDSLEYVIDEISKITVFDEHSLTLVRGPTAGICVEKFELFRQAYGMISSQKRSKNGLKGKFFKAVMKTIFCETEESFLAKRNSFKCLAAEKMINIDEQGNVCICEILSNPGIGNLRDYGYDLNKLLALPCNVKRLHELKKLGCDCHWDCAIYASLLFGGTSGYKKILSNMVNKSGFM